jgi:hypothetical protein
VWAGEALANKLLFGVFEAQDEDGIRNIVDKFGGWSRLELALYLARHDGPKWTKEVGIRPEEIQPSGAVEAAQPVPTS